MNQEATLPPKRGSTLAAVRTGKTNAKWTLCKNRLLLLTAWLAVWQLISYLELLPPVMSSSPAEVFGFIYQETFHGNLGSHVVATLSAAFIAFVAASVVGIVCGLALFFLPRVEEVLAPFISALNSMPRIALGPLFLLYFGFGLGSKVALAFSVVFFVLLLSARAGPMSADPDYLRLATVLGATKRQIFLKVLVPVSIPTIFSGLNLGLTYSLLGVITMELIAARAGLGAQIVYYSNVFEIKGIYGILIVMAIIASLLNFAMSRVEKRLLRWQPPSAS